MATTDRDIIDRDHVDDVDAIMEIARTNTNPDEVIHAVKDNAGAIFTWTYDKGASGPSSTSSTRKPRPRVERHHRSRLVDRGRPVHRARPQPRARADGRLRHVRRLAPSAAWGDKEWRSSASSRFKWRLSQFLHGEQGALLCTAKIVETVPWIDASTTPPQVVDEARHVEVFAPLPRRQARRGYPVNPHLGLLLDDIIDDSRWDMTYLGMQIMVEGLALAAFGFMHDVTTEPLLKKLLRYVMSDEARHVAFGAQPGRGVRTDECRGDPRTSGVRVRSRPADAGPVPAAGGVEPWASTPAGWSSSPRHARRGEGVPAHAVLQDRAELPQARASRRRRRLVAGAVHRDRRHRVRALREDTGSEFTDYDLVDGNYEATSGEARRRGGCPRRRRLRRWI
ncbi:MAG: ferritin-like domain-containing protein [Acidimicrobiales bacterium]